MPFFTSGSPESLSSTAAPDYHALAQFVVRQGHWSPAPRKLFQALGHAGTNLLMHLITVGKSNSNDGWITIAPRFLESGLALSVRRQEVLLARLKVKGVVTVTTMKGVRHCKINDVAVRALLTR